MCQDQVCWLNLPFVDYLDQNLQEKFKTKTFRPQGPSGKNDWLSTTDINLVMRQYEDKYDDFRYLGTVPLDFQEVYQEFAEFNFNELIQSNKTKIGMVVNLDNHNESGSHWVAVYSDLKTGEIYFFDSYGTKPDTPITQFMIRIREFCKSQNVQTKVKYNKTRHQYKNSECGVYSINMILKMLKGKTFDEHNSKKIKDDRINRCRYKYFSNRIKGLDA